MSKSTSPFENPDMAGQAQVAASAPAFAAYTAGIQRTITDAHRLVEGLQGEIRIHCRRTRAEGDRWVHAWHRARQVERQLAVAEKGLREAMRGLERSANARSEFDQRLQADTDKRRERKALKAAKRRAAIQAAPNPAATADQAAPVTSIHDMKRKSA